MNRILEILFLTILFFVFYSPINAADHIELIGVKVSYAEIAFILLPVINLFLVKRNNQVTSNRTLNEIIIVFFAYLFVIEFVKEVMMAGSPGAYVKSIRLSLPLLSGLILIMTSLRVRIKLVWKVLLVTIILSNLIAVLAYIFNIYQYLPPDELFILSGRLFNSNSSFGVIGLYLLFESRDYWYNKGWLPTTASLFSIGGLLLSGNRTYLILMTIMLTLFVFRKFSIASIFRGSFVLGLAVFVVFQIYLSNDFINRQIDKRITPLIQGNTEVIEDAYYGGREIILESVLDHIDKHHWIVGLPYSEPIFDYGLEAYIKFGRGEMKMTDTSFVNFMLRYGILSLVLYLIIFIKIYRANYLSSNPSRIFLWVYPFYFFASINVDSLISQNSVFFITIILFVRVELDNNRLKTRNSKLIEQST